ncbi:hypothetical protein HK097_001206 [Rhizophlyctis rosea]|uniref:beta-galactosidase n=1 Tax=Rhizophlyctis rosea TaxID=64517 RepID=A0AAD5SJ63_9FUNG|nr:hypothetical protein HK097_001206 [Rhizophlyctis rosea]
MIDTYVFWNLHEEVEGRYDFHAGYANLPLFLQYAQAEGLLVNLRIGPYVCAEWTYGGLPVWLLKKEGIELRTNSKPFMDSMETFVRKTLDVVQPFLASNGGPIALLQMENEYGNIAQERGKEGREYILWAAELAQSLNVGIPWIMCQQDDIPIVINTCNGFYCDNWIEGHHKRFPDQPAMFTEHWTGWFQHFGNPRPTRHASDIAFSTARFIAKGGTYNAYYMWHGGTNFGRWGSSYKTASYDYDAPMTEYGYPAVPKYEHLKKLHEVLNRFKNLILNNDPRFKKLAKEVELHTYGEFESLAFYANWNDEKPYNANIGDQIYTLDPWSVTIFHIFKDQATKLYSTSTITPQIPPPHKYSRPETSDLTLSSSHIWWKSEPQAPRHGDRIIADRPREQIRTTWDESDYMWYVREVEGVLEGEDVKIEVEEFQDVGYLYWNGELKGVLVGGKTEDFWDGMEKTTLRSAEGKTTVMFTNTEAKQSHTLAVLSTVTGLQNDGPYMERIQKGILGKVAVNGVDVTQGQWIHQVGLFWDAPRQSSLEDWQITGPPLHTPLTHYRLTFAVKDLLSLSTNATSSLPNPKSALPSFALDLSTMARGFAVVNNHPIGRYWNVTAEPWENCGKECKWEGGFWVGKCVERCAQRSQRFWHVPFDWVLEATWRGDDGEKYVVVELFEERGGDVNGIEFVALAG